jgi:hypothetical protein
VVANLSSVIVAFSLKSALFAVAIMKLISAGLQLSLISNRDWSALFSRVDRMQGTIYRYVCCLSLRFQGTMAEPVPPTKFLRISSTESTLSALSISECDLDEHDQFELTVKGKLD